MVAWRFLAFIVSFLLALQKFCLCLSKSNLCLPRQKGKSSLCYYILARSRSVTFTLYGPKINIKIILNTIYKVFLDLKYTQTDKKHKIFNFNNIIECKYNCKYITNLDKENIWIPKKLVDANTRKIKHFLFIFWEHVSLLAQTGFELAI
jgi:hypothetical protein